MSVNNSKSSDSGSNPENHEEKQTNQVDNKATLSAQDEELEINTLLQNKHVQRLMENAQLEGQITEIEVHNVLLQINIAENQARKKELKARKKIEGQEAPKKIERRKANKKLANVYGLIALLLLLILLLVLLVLLVALLGALSGKIK